MDNESRWEFIGNGNWRHAEYGRVSLDESYRRTYRANTLPNGSWRTLLRAPSGRVKRFRSKESAMRDLELRAMGAACAAEYSLIYGEG